MRTVYIILEYFFPILLQIVLPSKTIENQAILDTLTKQANSGIYRLRESTFQDFHERVQRQQTRLTEWDSFDIDGSEP